MNDKITRWSSKPIGKGKRKENSQISWIPPRSGSLKIKVDGAFLEREGAGAVSWVCRDSSGMLIDGFASSVQVRSPLHAETLALLEALKWLNSRGFEEKECKEIELESDNLFLVRMLQGTDQVSWEVHALMRESKDLLIRVKGLRLAHCARTQNKVADWIVKAQVHNILPLNWVFNPPQALWDLLCSEALFVYLSTV
ncbi:uncharacterized protein LOC130137532 [Syzygium oleosum]|uniref:uncharacterized protein LOC130137532 n=1 Tax=Syzygium oleosum TaxID=219896 RepID=UPI0024BB5046|nr:uncharacterized protein LOC130137532 [Syzygium oleosum]